MLTIDQKCEIYRACLEGKSLEAAGKPYGISRQRVFQILRDPLERSTRRYSRDDTYLVIYPAVRAWIEAHSVNLNEFCERAALVGAHVRPRTMREQLIGIKKLRSPTINAVMIHTGLRPEVAFELPDEDE